MGKIGRCPDGKRELDTGLFRNVADGIDSAVPRLKLTRPVGPDMMLNPGNEHAIGRIAGCWRRGREAEGGGLLNRYTGLNLYRGFESLRLRSKLGSDSIRFITNRGLTPFS